LDAGRFAEDFGEGESALGADLAAARSAIRFAGRGSAGGFLRLGVSFLATVPRRLGLVPLGVA